MSAQIELLEMNEDRYKVESPVYGEKDYAFTFAFTGINAVWQKHDVDSASLVAKPNIWMGERTDDHYIAEQRQGAADKRVFSYREGRSFTLVCLNDQLYLMLRTWEEDKNGKVAAASRHAKSAVKVATRTVSGKAEPLIFSHEDPCVIKLETKDGSSVVKVWNTTKSGEAPFLLADFGEDFKDFFSGFSEFQFNTIPLAIKNGQHSLRLERVAAWVGNPRPEGEKNFRDYLSEKKHALKCFGYRQLPLEQLSAYYPLQRNRWSTRGPCTFDFLESTRFEMDVARGLCFDAFKNKCSIVLRPSETQGASGSALLSVSLSEARLSRITTVAAQIGEWSKSTADFSKRRHWLSFKSILEDIEAFDPAEPFVLSPHYKDGTIAAVISSGKLTTRLPQFMKLLGATKFSAEHQMKETLSYLQAKLNEEKNKLYNRREKIGALTVKTSEPEKTRAFNIQLLRRMSVDSNTSELSYEEKIVFNDNQGNDRGLMDLNGFPCFLLLSLSDDRKALSLFAARPDRAFPTTLTPALTYEISHESEHSTPQKNQTITEVVLELGLGVETLDGPLTISIKDLSLWRTALWQREGVLTAGNEADSHYNVKTLAHLSFSGSLNRLIEQYEKSSAF